MRNQLQSSGKPLSRRKFIAQSTATAVGLSIVPRRVLGGPGYVSPSDKINTAFIGVGAQGFRVMLHFLSEPDAVSVTIELKNVLRFIAAGPRYFPVVGSA